MERKIPILVIDDEPGNLEIISEYLEDQDYAITTALDGESALHLITESSIPFQAVLLDWMMPGVDGLEVLTRIKNNPDLRHLPVIMQTARTGHDDLLKGMEAGAFYYLSKPFRQDTLCTILAAAISDGQRYTALRDELRQKDETLHLLRQAQFEFRSLEEAQRIASFIAQATPVPDKIIMGLSELLINAVEHGNLNIGYDEKSRLKTQGNWQEEILRRLQLPEYRDKYATLEFLHTDDQFIFTITDQGQGFSPDKFLQLDPERAYDNHGRGIYMARLISFEQIEFRNNGAQVIATAVLSQD